MCYWQRDIVVMTMKKKIELPLLEPMYSTYHHQAPGTAIIERNPSIRNWYLNQVMILNCSRKFLTGYTSPELNIVDAHWKENPYFHKSKHSIRFYNGYVHPIIRNMIDAGYYVFFSGIDDYYVQGKTWYHERHFCHDGMICGYNRENKTYCIYAYDNNWVYRKFWTPQKAFDAGRRAMFREGIYGKLYGLLPKDDRISFDPQAALSKICEYLDSDMDKYPENGEGKIYGIVVQEYIAKYLDKLLDGSIPYERIDGRIFRLIWEHKKAMLERIILIEQSYGYPDSISSRYRNVVTYANQMRMLYASHLVKRRDSVLVSIRKMLIELIQSEYRLLSELTYDVRGGKQ